MIRNPAYLAILVLIPLLHCAPRELTGTEIAGRWRAVLESPGGELPFELRISDSGGSPRAEAINGDEAVPFTEVRLEGRSIELRIDHYDSAIVASVSDSGDSMRGSWSRQGHGLVDTMPFRAERHEGEGPARFEAAAGESSDDPGGEIAGTWDVVFTDEDGQMPAVAELRREGSHVWGTFATPLGDYRYLEGDTRAGTLRLSCFDGAHAFLFRARMQEDGTLSGDFWSRARYHATWVARPTTAESSMPDPFQMTSVTDPGGGLEFSFPDLDGNPVSSTDDRFKGKVVLVDIFGSWCPNCNDQAPVLADLHRRYGDRGLEIVGLAYEMTGEPERDTVFVQRFASRHGITFPLLLAGTSDKAEASLTLPDLSGVLAFPTLVFVGRDGRVEAIHTGFAGPATGQRHGDLMSAYTELIDRLLGESPD